MRIIGFNPQATVDSVKELMQNGAEESLIKVCAFKAIGCYQRQHTSLDHLDSDITKYVSPRSQEITAFIRAFNQLDDTRDELLETNSDYKSFKESIKQAQKLFNQLPSNFSQNIEETAEIGSKTLEKYKKFKQCLVVCQSPLAGFYTSINAIKRLVDGESTVTHYEQEQAANFQNHIAYCLLDGISIDELKNRIPQYCFNHAELEQNSIQQHVLNIFDELVPKAEKTAQEIKEKREAETQQRPSQFLAALKTIQSTYERLKLDPAYQAFAFEKQEVNTRLQNLATFCTTTELTNHGKLMVASQNRLYRKIQASS